MMPVVFDASAVISGCGWRSESYRCLAAVARRRMRSFISTEIAEEWSETLRKLESRGTKFVHPPRPTLEWLLEISRYIAPAELGKRRSRDASDDIYLACALACRARFIVSRDPDLLALGKPFGVEVVTPRALLSRLVSGRIL